MPLCSPGCAQKPLAYGAGACRIQSRPAGVYKFLFLDCSVAIPALTVGGIGPLVEDGSLVASGKVLAGVAKGTTTKTKLSSCDPERPTGRTELWSFSDFNADNATAAETKFWNDKFQNQDRYLLGYTTCDELLYGFASTYGLELNPNRNTDALQAAFIEGVFDVAQLLLFEPTHIPGINALFQTTGTESS